MKILNKAFFRGIARVHENKLKIEPKISISSVNRSHVKRIAQAFFVYMGGLRKRFKQLTTNDRRTPSDSDINYSR